MQGGRSALHAPGGHQHPVNVPSFAVVGGGHNGSTNELSPGSWSRHSSPHETGDVNASTLFQREPHEDNRPQPECSSMVMEDATAGMDLQSNVEALARPSSDIASIVAAIVLSVVTTASLSTVNDTEARMHDEENEEDDTSEDSKKKKESMFLEGVELIDLDNCDVLDIKLQCDSKDTNDEEAPNWKEMDVDIGAPSCVQTIQPNSSTTMAQAFACSTSPN